MPPRLLFRKHRRLDVRLPLTNLRLGDFGATRARETKWIRGYTLTNLFSDIDYSTSRGHGHPTWPDCPTSHKKDNITIPTLVDIPSALIIATSTGLIWREKSNGYFSHHWGLLFRQSGVPRLHVEGTPTQALSFRSSRK